MTLKILKWWREVMERRAVGKFTLIDAGSHEVPPVDDDVKIAPPFIKRLGDSILKWWRKTKGFRNWVRKWWKKIKGSQSLPNQKWSFSSIFIFFVSVLTLPSLVFFFFKSEVVQETFRWIAFLVGGVIFVASIIMVTRKYASSGSVLKNVIVGIVGFIILHYTVFTFWPTLWEVWFSDTSFFVGTNLAMLAFILFPSLFGNEETRKKADMGKSWALVLGITLAIGMWGWLRSPHAQNAGGESGGIWRDIDGPAKDAVLTAFPDDTTMWNIAAAESRFRQFSNDTTPLQNTEGSSAFGVFQIMESAHGRDCGISGVDIYTLEGNIACARKLRDQNPNYSDWDRSSSKWRGQSENPRAIVVVEDDEITDSLTVEVPRGGESEAVEIPVGWRFLRIKGETSDSFTIISPSGGRYMTKAGKVAAKNLAVVDTAKENQPLPYETGDWKFAVDSSIGPLRIHVTRVRLRD